MGGKRKKCRKERAGSVAANSDNLGSYKEAGGGAQDDKAFRSTIAPGVKPPNFNMDVDINDFHCSFYHVHEGFLRETVLRAQVRFVQVERVCPLCRV